MPCSHHRIQSWWSVGAYIEDAAGIHKARPTLNSIQFRCKNNMTFSLGTCRHDHWSSFAQIESISLFGVDAINVRTETKSSREWWADVDSCVAFFFAVSHGFSAPRVETIIIAIKSIWKRTTHIADAINYFSKGILLTFPIISRSMHTAHRSRTTTCVGVQPSFRQ